MSYGRPTPTQAQLQQYVPQTAINDVIWGPLYDAANYSTAGQQFLQFYTQQQGQGVSTAPSALAGSAKTILDTNLQAAGQLTLGNAFFATGIELLFFPGANPNEGAITGTGTSAANFLNDLYSWGKDGVLTLTVGSNRIYAQDGPLGIFPPSVNIAAAAAIGVSGATANLTITQYWSDYGSWVGEAYTIEPLFLQANLQFNAVLSWGSAVALPSGKAARIFTRLRGYQIRLAQ